MDPNINQPQQTIPPIPSGSSNRSFVKTLGIGMSIVSFCVAIAIGGYLFGANKNSEPKQIACTMEAKLCPDGTNVGRSGPKCEFAPCPTSTPDPTANWKTYNNPAYGEFTFKYPPESQIVEQKPAQIVTLFYPNQSPQEIKFTTNFYILAESPEEFNLSKSELQKKYSLTPIAINGYKGFSYSDSSAGFENKYVFLDNGQGKFANIITGIRPSNNQYLKTNEQILSTFKFTK